MPKEGSRIVFVFVVDNETVRAAKVVFRTRSADRREFLVAVDIELDLALAPPAVVVDAPGHVSANIMSRSFDAVQYCVDVLIRKRIGAPELCVEVGCVIGDIGERVVDLVVENFPVRIAVFRS